MTQPESSLPRQDFTRPREAIAFRLGGTDYEAPAVIGGPTIRRIVELTTLAEGLQTAEVIGKIGQAFAAVIPGEVGKQIEYRIVESDDDPVELHTEAIPCLYYLMERWGLRPTMPSSPSSDGSASPTGLSGDMSSTDGVSPSESANTS